MVLQTIRKTLPRVLTRQFQSIPKKRNGTQRKEKTKERKEARTAKSKEHKKETQENAKRNASERGWVLVLPARPCVSARRALFLLPSRFPPPAQPESAGGRHGSRKKCGTLLDLCVSSLRRGHANLLCIVPTLTDVPRKESRGFQFHSQHCPRVRSGGCQ